MTAYPRKADIVGVLLGHLNKERGIYERIAAQARLDAIDGEMKQEGKYDTRAIEASYLAGAQKRRLEEIVYEIQSLQGLDLSLSSRAVALGSLVALDKEESPEPIWYFLSPTSGGIEATSAGSLVKVISIRSPLAKVLIGLGEGDAVEGTSLPLALIGTQVEKIL